MIVRQINLKKPICKIEKGVCKIKFSSNTPVWIRFVVMNARTEKEIYSVTEQQRLLADVEYSFSINSPHDGFLAVDVYKSDYILSDEFEAEVKVNE